MIKSGNELIPNRRKRSAVNTDIALLVFADKLNISWRDSPNISLGRLSQKYGMWENAK